MDHPTAQAVADLLQRSSESIVQRWLDRLSERVTLERQCLFPSDDLLDHVPILVEGMARTLTSPEPITMDTPVVLKARELGRMRFDQGFSAHQILWEYQLLGAVMLHHIEAEGPVLTETDTRSVMRRLFEALTSVQRATMEEFLDHYERMIHEREERLRGFNHALTHELRNDLGAVLGAARMLREGFIADTAEERDRFVGIVIENAERIDRLVANLVDLSDMGGERRRHRNVLLTHAATEAARHLRDFAASRGVEIRIAADLPAVEVNAAAVELALSNLIGNGIKYSDPDRAPCWVEVRRGPGQAGLAVVDVADNGRGVPPADRGRLFERHFRSDGVSEIEGTGLGLFLVRSAVDMAGGAIQACFPDSGETVFRFSLPARRVDDVDPDACAS